MSIHRSAQAPHSPALGFGLAAAAAALFSTKPILIKWAYQYGIDATQLLALRMIMVLPIYLAIGVVVWQRQKPALSVRQWLGVMGTGLLGYYVASYLDVKGLEYASAQLERIILYAYPTMVVIMSSMFLGTTISRRKYWAMGLCYAGICTIFLQDFQFTAEQFDGNSDDVIVGATLILISAFTYAGYMLLSKAYIDQLGAILFTCIAMGSATSGIMLHSVIELGITSTKDAGSSLIAVNAKLLGIIALLTIAATLIPSFLTSAAVKIIGADNASLTGTLGPIITTILAVLFLGEHFTWAHATGMALVILGIHILSRRPK